ncbi:sodium/calcium exchanger 3 isoform X1 [Vombatus ursinus]|uniref:sodium/calcium exchanger 3 isoform X1 n=1 Tax=Vombatus ursinus TaxID=29139 RepID=UPI000FFCF0DB|nr:sodium/calcium exchanger 3 isoform X1 [Vombatus ursinus]XP_027700582.1 sodium/calcium exchanger 3 isoform X1 [Vombatus ursinus]XP_027700583.1 sodium/calcium exchanger 3 isoform X1 [Vombatus ursinus]XP_027700584.1 sodium/calcium exchanger 3 isoform X1 [Vombatus ursinus]XP_027700585.1 sodium/calcium exchanger 3 isoform X1 [Vombatus ursinus]XP_027700592.1 sodium/calcium exchanger 3 isoform X1 [Vombatus ursinus]XP_027700593.1 sodium/calcium exchanger 3 isoform X1 [Vombatus ursinus]XP_02770059
MAWSKLRPLTSAFLHFGLVTFALFLNGLRAEANTAGDVESTGQNNESCSGSSDCKEGVILPIWYPENPSLGDKIARVIVYFVALIYMFLGVSIIADRFMASIEVITSQEREVTIKKPNGETSTTTIRVWNETVSNLTLMALGSSAPEILLSLIEVCGHGFIAGDLGPSTIVGSAAFNMFIIIGICVYVIPDGETRKIKHLRVFFITAAWSIFAYIWLYMILAVFSPGVVQVWEGLLTLFFFPICVLLAWMADRRLLFYKYMHKKYRTDKHRGIIIETEGDHPKGIEMDGKMMNSHFLDGSLVMMEGKEVDESRREMIRILKDLKQKHPEKDLEQLVEMANYCALSHQQKSRAFYRIQATRMMTGAGNILKKHAAERAKRSSRMGQVHTHEPEDFVSKVFFDPCSYQCLENCGAVLLTVVRKGGDTSKTVYVDYKTEDGSANAGADYEFTEGTVVLKPGETQKEFSVGIIDDDIFEEDEHFFVRLSNVRIVEEPPDEGLPPGTIHNLPLPRAVLSSPSVATVTILDDDHAGIFTFECDVIHVSESIGVMEVKVLRTSGARGTVIIPFRTVEGTAKGGGEDFEDTYGELEFKNDETVKTVRVKIVDEEEYERQENFFIALGEPKWMERGISGKKVPRTPNMRIPERGRPTVPGSRRVSFPHPPLRIETTCHEKDVTDRKLSMEEEEAKRIAEMGKPVLGEHPKLEVIIEESYEFKSTVDKLIKKTNLALVVGTHSWRDQFMEAITVSAAGDEDEDESGEERLPSCFDYVMHFLTVFWKVLFACVPPTEYCHGWACFVVSILIIGMLTAIIGDLASHFGCTIGLKDSVTAVVFVAFGTSVPDTFASKAAAIQDVYADASIGNVTGSNAVNVFLGIGLAWSVAAIYWALKGQEFHVSAGTLAFSVTLFTIFAFVCISVLLYRRRPHLGGELGGPRGCRLATTLLFVTLWLLYILFATLEAYCYIKGF